MMNSKINEYQEKLNQLGFQTSVDESIMNFLPTETLRGIKNNLFVCIRVDESGDQDFSLSLQRDNFIYRLPNFYRDFDALLSSIRQFTTASGKVA